MTKRRIGLPMLVCALFAVAVLPTHTAGGLAPSGEISQEQAIATAFQYTGLGVQADVTVSAERATVPADDDVPFLRLAGKPAWRVTLNNVRILTRGSDGKAYENPNIHSLDVWLDRADGRLLKITSPFPADVDPSTRPALAGRQKRMTDSYETYTGFPRDVPAINFM